MLVNFRAPQIDKSGVQCILYVGMYFSIYFGDPYMLLFFDCAFNTLFPAKPWISGGGQREERGEGAVALVDVMELYSPVFRICWLDERSIVRQRHGKEEGAFSKGQKWFPGAP